MQFSSPTSPVRRANPVFVLIVGIVFLLLAGWLTVRSYTLSQGSKAQGGVIAVKTTYSTDSHGQRTTIYAPIVQFTAADGTTHSFTSSVSSSAQPDIGARVQVVYDPTHPDQAEIDSVATLWFFPILCLAVGLLLLLGGAFGMRKSLRNRRLLRDGAVADATITASKPHGTMGVTVATTQSRTGWDLTATANDPVSGQPREYKAWLPSAMDPLAMGITTLKVYVSRTNPKDYFLDTSSVPSMGQALGSLLRGQLPGGTPSGAGTFVAAQPAMRPDPNAIMPDAGKLFGAPAVPMAPPAPVNPQLAAYVASAKTAGQDAATIRQTLVSTGWNAADVENALK